MAWPWSRKRKTFDTPPRPIDQIIAEAFGRGVAPRVGRTEALSVPAVQRGRNLICSVATLPLRQHGPDRSVVPFALLDQLDPDVPNVVTLSQTLEDLLFESVSWWLITAQDFAGYPVSVRHLDYTTVSVDPPKDRSPAPLPSGLDPRSPFVWVDGQQVSAERVIRFDSPNPAVLKVGGRAIRRALLLDQAASVYADDPRPLDYFEPAEGAEELSDDEQLQLLATWKAARKERSTAFIPASLKYSSVDTPSPQELQLVELQKQASLDIANALGVDPEDLGVSTTSRTYANAVDRRRDRINDVLSPYMRAITDRLTMGDVTRRGYTIRFDLDDYMRANPTERWATYQVGKTIGAITVEEIREEEGLPPMPETDTPEAAPLAEVTPIVDAVTADRPAAMRFDAEPALTFANVPVVEFSVNREARTIEGLVVPYGAVGTKDGTSFRFDKGSLQWSTDNPGRVKLMFPRHTAAVGKAVQLSDTPAGLLAKFSVGRGPEGDRALESAEDGVFDGFSVGVDFTSRDTVPDPSNKGAVLVRRADLRHVALTDEPVFDDARVTRVAASRTNQGGPTMAETETVEPPAAPETPAPEPVTQTFSADQVRQLLAQQAPVEPRQVVDPTRSLQLSVTEPAPYRFDRKGNLHPAAHEFSADIIAGLRDGDVAAYDRVMEFVRVQFDVITTDVNELNPVQNRPEMYVDQRAFRYPVWDAISKGTLANITPFTFPKFSSASGLVGAHTEGTEPSSGTFVATNQTVTPVAISGKAKISRETWDQGGNPQIGNLIWRQMEKGWFEALEAAAVAVLDAATPTGITLTATATDGQLQAGELKAAMAALHYVRGGFTMTDAFAQVDLYQMLVGAEDDTGRALFPAIGPSNADGTVSSRYQSVDVNGVPFLPAWALAATGVVAASSYLFDRESVHGWASAPQRLAIDATEVANVYIGLWGYRATAISDIAGVREIIYDPSAS